MHGKEREKKKEKLKSTGAILYITLSNNVHSSANFIKILSVSRYLQTPGNFYKVPSIKKQSIVCKLFTIPGIQVQFSGVAITHAIIVLNVDSKQKKERSS